MEKDHYNQKKPQWIVEVEIKILPVSFLKSPDLRCFFVSSLCTVSIDISALDVNERLAELLHTFIMQLPQVLRLVLLTVALGSGTVAKTVSYVVEVVFATADPD